MKSFIKDVFRLIDREINENNKKICKENVEGVLTEYLKHKELTESDIAVLVSLLLNISESGKKILNHKQYADFTVERYLSYLRYYMEWNREHEEVDPFAMAVTMVRKEILEILENENNTEYEN